LRAGRIGYYCREFRPFSETARGMPCRAMKRSLILAMSVLWLSGCSVALFEAREDEPKQLPGGCSIERWLRTGSICEQVAERERPAPREEADASLHCFRTLADIDCYREKEPFAQRRAAAMRAKE
jgi:hypothetical protein